MTSFQIGVKPSRRAAARFVARVRRRLNEALAEERAANGVTQSDLARAIDVNRSVISRELNGKADITLGRIAELAWAMGREVEFDLVQPEVAPGANVPITISPAIWITQATGPASAAQVPTIKVSEFKSFEAVP
ncbi:helix-turn-helix domain-containing protein [Sphingomonas sp. YL-JM2C]